MVPARDTVARWGGDEFAVLVENAAGEHEVADLAERLAEAIAGAPFKVADREVALTASVGVVVAGSGEETDLLLRNADVAMSRAKAGGRWPGRGVRRAHARRPSRAGWSSPVT